MVRRYGFILCATLMLAACGDGDDGGGSATVAERLAALGIGRDFGIQPSSMVQNGEWEEYRYDTADERAICLFGTPYQVNLHRGSSNNLFVYLEGGGACWNYDTCYNSMLAKPTANSAFPFGYVAPGNPDNPFRNWNIVWGSYCDGSVWTGDNTVDYAGNRTYHHGIQNLSALLTLAQREFPNPDQILVTGSSAGGYGTYLGYGVTRVAYPDTQIDVINDSGPGLQNSATPETNAERENNWNFRQYVPPDCTDCDRQYTFLTDWALDQDPTLRIGYFSYLQDSIIRFFLGLEPDGFEALLRATTDELHARHPDRFQRYFIQGAGHTALELPLFNTIEANGVRLRDWAADIVTGGPAFRDVVED